MEILESVKYDPSIIRKIRVVHGKLPLNFARLERVPPKYVDDERKKKTDGILAAMDFGFRELKEADFGDDDVLRLTAPVVLRGNKAWYVLNEMSGDTSGSMPDRRE
jgi:hypothetical protein